MILCAFGSLNHLPKISITNFYELLELTPLAYALLVPQLLYFLLPYFCILNNQKKRKVTLFLHLICFLIDYDLIQKKKEFFLCLLYSAFGRKCLVRGGEDGN